MQYTGAPKVGAGATAGAGGALAYTGFDVVGMILIAVALIVLGFVLVRSGIYGRPLFPRRGK